MTDLHPKVAPPMVDSLLRFPSKPSCRNFKRLLCQDFAALKLLDARSCKILQTKLTRVLKYRECEK